MIRRAGSTSTAKTVFNEVNNAIKGSGIQRRGGANAASVPSDIPKPSRPGKKIPINERRVMVESYVNKYRESNAGKFPSITDTCKEVGGSFYVVRKIVQELEYNSKVDPPISGKESLGPKKTAGKSESVTVQNASTGGVKVDAHVAEATEKALEVELALKTSETMLYEEIVETKIQENSDLATTEHSLLEEDTKGIHLPCPESSDEVKETQRDKLDSVVGNSNLLREKAGDQCSGLEVLEKEDAASHFLSAESHLQKFDSKNVYHPFVEITEEDNIKRPACDAQMDNQINTKELPEQDINLLDKKADNVFSTQPEDLKKDDATSPFLSTESHVDKFQFETISHPYTASTGEDKEEHLVSGDIRASDHPKHKEEFPKQDKTVLAEKVDNGFSNQQEHLRKEDVDSSFVSTESHLDKFETKNISYPKAESTGEDKKEHLVSGDIRDPDHPKHKEELPEQDKYLQDTLTKQMDETKPPKESTLWGNLKSFAGGIINMWRKL
ncbi:hypothetical protein Tsubulata_006316 [Turnera subulata]|uniref:AT3G52170-like helix-turn-helix domain-containing protein n=1 Tax=Turnera subulata TaxID=218843 RepID=A0A9Q0G6T1_9ROSI|nr:hypothetical protein Tsubulata_006316 [Turnera subulata]